MDLVERQAIVDLLNRYGWTLDDRDWDGLADCFTPDAVADYGPGLGKQDGPAAIVALCRGVLERLDSTQHVITNHEVTITGDRAKTRCYLVAQHTKAGVDGGANFTLGGCYLDDVVRTPAGWRIARREMRVLWQEGNQAVLGG